RLRNHARHPPAAGAADAADHRDHRQGDEGRPREMPGGRCLGLPGQAGDHRRAAGGAAAMVGSLSHAPCAASAGAAAPGPVAEPVRILLVDDQPARLLTYTAILEPLGECLVQARSGREALQRLMEDDYALILLDVN